MLFPPEVLGKYEVGKFGVFLVTEKCYWYFFIQVPRTVNILRSRESHKTKIWSVLPEAPVHCCWEILVWVIYDNPIPLTDDWVRKTPVLVPIGKTWGEPPESFQGRFAYSWHKDTEETVLLPSEQCLDVRPGTSENNLGSTRVARLKTKSVRMKGLNKAMKWDLGTPPSFWIQHPSFPDP